MSCFQRLLNVLVQFMHIHSALVQISFFSNWNRLSITGTCSYLVIQARTSHSELHLFLFGKKLATSSHKDPFHTHRPQNAFLHACIHYDVTLFTCSECEMTTDMKLLVHITFLAATIVAVHSVCPAEWFISEFDGILDQEIASPLLVIDPNVTFFTDIMLFSDAEIEETTQDAIRFFNTRFGLDFSQSTPNELRQRFFQNATMFPSRVPPEIEYLISYNRWIVTGKTRTFCYPLRDGAFLVTFSGEQILHGTYGGVEGKPIGVLDALLYGFYNIPVCPQQPIVIQYQSGTPLRTDPVDGFQAINCEVFHRVLGRGLAQGVANSQPTPEDPSVIHHTVRLLFAFPAHP